MAFQRANPHLEEIVEILDLHLEKHKGDVPRAISYLSKGDSDWIDEELLKSMSDPRYFISNYFAYRDEDKGFKGLYPLFDSQEMLCEEYRRLKKKYGKVRALVLKARQMGATTYNCAEFFQQTIFSEHINAIMVGQDEDQTQFIMGMYESALDFIPWWMKPRIKLRQTGKYINFDERDETIRLTRPGLKTWIYGENANKPSGVGRGRTFGRAHLSELAFWKNAEQLSESLFPTFNTPDGFYVMESTANGRNDAWHNLWRGAELGEVDWHPIFIPFYRREKTYSLPIPEGETFVLDKTELEMRERVYQKEKYLIKDATFNWMRKRKQEFRRTSKGGDDSKFYQEYTSEAEESFQASAVTAFPRDIITRWARLTKEPKWVGEIRYDMDVRRPIATLREVGEREECRYKKNEDRFHVWKKPELQGNYVVGADVALGGDGGDFSVVQVIKLSKGHEQHEQVACWKGRINPNAFAGVVAAIGSMYNEALVAVEVNTYGTATNFRVMHEYEYENIYRFKRLDRIKNMYTDISGFLMTPNSADGLMAQMSEAFLEDTLYIACRYTMDEFNDYTEDGAKGAGAHDDMVDALMIALFCGLEGVVQDRQQGRKRTPTGNPNTFIIKDRFGNTVGETHSQNEAKRIAALHLGSITTRNSGSTAMVKLPWKDKAVPVPADFQNTDYSPLHDGTGTARRLYEDEEVPAEEITPEMIAAYEEMEQQREDSPDAWKYS